MNPDRMVRFGIINDDDDKILAYVGGWSIVDLEGEDEYQFTFSDIQWMPCNYNSSFIIGNLRLGILSNTGLPIGEYFVPLEKLTKWRDLGDQEWILDTAMNEAISREEVDMWELLRDQNDLAPYLWLSFSQHQREIWLKIVRYHSLYRHIHTDQSSVAGEGMRSFTLDMQHVQEKVSFFLMLGECLNGPASYYGVGQDSLQDCLYGGFGVAPPFRLQILHAPDKNMSISDTFGKEFWQCIECLQHAGVEVAI
ncbi:hypothetical protein [Paenibacillus kandeliae]|uniref:hypothetical protein n=1 Tax=Paenibacillus kandeliae TaxID=3231269 RepID=UPI003457AEA0